MKKGKDALCIQPIYSIVIYYILGVISFTLILVPTLLSWEESKWMIKILWYVIMILFLVFGLIMGTLHIQFAEIDKETIIIKNLFYIIADVKWNDVASVKKKRILTYDSRGYISLEWIVIRTDENQKIDKAKVNKKNVFPILIIANRKNLSILKKYVKIEKERD